MSLFSTCFFKRFAFCSLVSIAFLNHCYSQIPSIAWQSSIGGDQTETPHRIVPDPAGEGSYVLGDSQSGISGDRTEASYGGQDVWLAKLDGNGEVLWQKAYGGSAADFGMDLLIHNDVLYILSRSASPASGNKIASHYGSSDYWLIACDLTGAILWQKAYGGNDNDLPTSIIVLQNGHLLIAGDSYSNTSGNKTQAKIGEQDFWIVEVMASNGVIVKQKCYGGTDFETMNKVIQSESGSIYLTGNSSSDAGGDKSEDSYGYNDLWVVKLDENLNKIADKGFGGSRSEEGRFGNLLMDGDAIYLLTASYSDASGNKTSALHGDIGSNSDYWLIKIDTNLNLLWDKSFGGGDLDNGMELVMHPMGVLILLGVSYSPVEGTRTVPLVGYGDCWMIITDLEGNEMAQEAYGGYNGYTSYPSAFLTPEGNIDISTASSCIAAGMKTDGTNGMLDYWVFELKLAEFLDVTELVSGDLLAMPYPNPFFDKVSFDFTAVDEELTIRFFNTQGQLVDTKKAASNSVFEWTVSGDSQFYLYEISGSTIHANGRILKR